MKRMFLHLIKRQAFALVMLCMGATSAMAEQVVVTVSTYSSTNDPSVLKTALEAMSENANSNDIASITDLKIVASETAFLDLRDFAYLNSTLTSLVDLNLSDVHVTSRTNLSIDNTLPTNTLTNNTTVKHIILPTTAAGLSASAFSNSALEGVISLPASLNAGSGFIFSRAFGDSPNITGFISENYDVNSEGVITQAGSINQNGYKTVDGVVYNYWGTQLEYYPRGKQNEHYIISNTVITNQSSTTDIIKIGNTAIANNPYLKKLTLSSKTRDVQSAKRADQIAQGCTNFEAYYIEVGNTVFGVLDDLIIYDVSEKGISHVHANYKAETLTIDGSIIEKIGTTYRTFTFPSTSGLKNVVLTEGLKEICGSALKATATLESVEFPASLTTVNSGAFWDSGLKTIILKGNNLTAIEADAFRGTKATIIDIPASIARIKSRTFNITTVATFISRATVVPTNSQMTFESIPTNAILYVPTSSVDTYKASTWVSNAYGDNPDSPGNIIQFKGFTVNNILPFYTLTVNGGTGESPLASDIAAENQTVTIMAAAPTEGKVFDKWTVVSGGITIEDEGNATATFTMPAGDVEVTATYKNDTGSDMASSTINEEPVAVRYYTIQGVEVTAPAENNLYIVKKVYASKKSDVSKVIYKK
jgi:phage gp45-like